MTAASAHIDPVGEYLSRAPGTPVGDDTRAGGRPALRASGPADPNTIVMCGEVGRGEFTAATLLHKLTAAGSRPVTLCVDSRGGSTVEALRICAVIHNHQRGGQSPVTALVRNEASSAASLIVQACGRRRIGPEARMTVHESAGSWPGRGVAQGVTARDLLAACAARQLPDGARPAAAMAIMALRRDDEELVAGYAWRSKRPAAVWREAMAAERTYVGAGAVYAGLADEVAG